MRLGLNLKSIHRCWVKFVILGAGFFVFTALAIVLSKTQVFKTRLGLLVTGGVEYKYQIATLSAQIFDLQTADQLKRNDKLQQEIKNIQTTYNDSLKVYEKLADLRLKTKTQDLDKLLAASLKNLADKNYASASENLKDLSKKIEETESKLSQASTPSSTKSVPAEIKNTAPVSGYSRQAVQTDVGTFTVDIIAADLNSNKIIVDTASDSDCSNDCPVKSLGEYVSRSGAWAGINGNFFCPQEYPSCAGKTNSFDTLVMNKNKYYFNSDNNVYSVVPAAIFGPGWARFVGRSLEWGRDTGADSVIANHPLLVAGGQSNFGGNGDAKLSGKGSRTFLASKDSTAFIGIVYGATSSDAAKVLQTMGIQSAIGLDQGGSTALWHGGRYLAGPGRNIPTAVLIVRR